MGSGTGILCVIMAYLVNEVVGIDIYKKLIDYSINAIKINHSQLLDSGKIKLVLGDGWKGYPANSQKEIYDVIHVGATAEEIPKQLWKQLKKGGRMFIPLKNDDGSESINIIDKPEFKKNYGYLNLRKMLNVRYVPLQRNIKEFY